MSNVYYGCSVYRYPSLIAGQDDHKTPEEARAADRELAIRLVTTTLPSGYEMAMRGDRRPELVKALRWLAEEMSAAAMAAEAAPGARAETA